MFQSTVRRKQRVSRGSGGFRAQLSRRRDIYYGLARTPDGAARRDKGPGGLGSSPPTPPTLRSHVPRVPRGSAFCLTSSRHEESMKQYLVTSARIMRHGGFIGWNAPRAQCRCEQRVRALSRGVELRPIVISVACSIVVHEGPQIRTPQCGAFGETRRLSICISHNLWLLTFSENKIFKDASRLPEQFKIRQILASYIYVSH